MHINEIPPSPCVISRDESGRLLTMARKLQSVIFLAMHKGGSSFLARDLARAIDHQVSGHVSMNIGNQIDTGEHTYEDLAVPSMGSAVVRVYPTEFDQLVPAHPGETGPFSNVKIVALQRDPRDAAISRYFSVAFSHTPPPTTDTDAFLKRRDELVDLGPDGGMLRMVKPTMDEFEHFHRIVDSRTDALLTSYETMITDYRGWLYEVGRFVGWTTPEQERIFAQTKDALEFPVVGDPGEHVRRITPGNWRRYDRPKIRMAFDERAGELMAKSGYSWPLTKEQKLERKARRR